jgi:hypothetical protein
MDNTFRILKKDDKRSGTYQAYRKEWDRRGTELDECNAPLHLDIETTAVCDLKCGSNLKNPDGFCQIWTHKHIRKEGFKNHIYKPGMLSPDDYYRVLYEAVQSSVESVKLNFRGEPSLHPYIVEFTQKAAFEGFIDIMMNTNGNGGARKNPEIFSEIVKAGITNLMFSVDACSRNVYTQQRVNGDWNTLLNSVRSAVLARYMGLGNPDCRVRVSAVRTKLNASQIDSGEFEEFWIDKIGVDWASISECYFPGGVKHDWQACMWAQMFPSEFQCADPFRRMVVTWDLESTLPCCQGYTKQFDGGSLISKTIGEAWNSPRFQDLRAAHRERTWDTTPMCVDCPLTKKVVKYDV